MKTTKQQTEVKFDRDLDPYAETGIYPGYWDLSDIPELPENLENGLEASQGEESTPIDHGLAPGAMDEWHLAAYFEEHPTRHRRGWSAY